MKQIKNIFISAGDYSGDMHAAYLAEKLQQKDTTIKISAIGGFFLEKNKTINFVENIVKQQGFGFAGLLKKYFYFKNILNKKIIPFMQKESVELVILVDFYGFNIHLAEAAKNLGIKIVHYISPQVWASRKNRIFKIKKFTDLIIPILPFEAEIYEKIGVKTFYSGNPLVDIIDMQCDAGLRSITSCSDVSSSIALMPGSRLKEIKNILPMFLKILEGANIKGIDVFLIIPRGIDECFIKQIIAGKNIKIVEGPAYSLRKKVRFIMTSSGTATVENAILGTPMMIFYKLDKFSYFVAKLIAKIKYIGMPNILAGKMIMPEYIQKIDYRKAKETFCDWLNDDEIIKQKQDEIKKITGKLKPIDGYVLDNIAEYILGSFDVTRRND